MAIIVRGKNWNNVTLKGLPIRILCSKCSEEMNNSYMYANLAYGGDPISDKDIDDEWEWLLLHCKNCNIEIALPLRFRQKVSKDQFLIGRD